MNDKPILINPNQDDPQKLTQVPGIGPELAGRIVDARPFENLEDMQRVSGIGPNVLTKLQPYLDIEPATEAAAVNGSTPVDEVVYEATADVVAAVKDIEVVAEPPLEELQPVKIESKALSPVVDVEPFEPAMEAAVTDQPAPKAAEAKTPEIPEAVTKTNETNKQSGDVKTASPKPEAAANAQPAGISRSQMWWAVLAGSLVTLILGVALALAVLANLNNGLLRYATPGQIDTLSAQIDAAQARNEQLAQDLEGLRERVANLETLGQRVTAVEQAAGDLSSDIDNLGTQVDQNTQMVTAMEEEVSALGEQSSRVQTFLDGMRNLLTELFPVEEGGK